MESRETTRTFSDIEANFEKRKEKQPNEPKQAKTIKNQRSYTFQTAYMIHGPPPTLKTQVKSNFMEAFCNRAAKP